MRDSGLGTGNCGCGLGTLGVIVDYCGGSEFAGSPKLSTLNCRVRPILFPEACQGTRAPPIPSMLRAKREGGSEGGREAYEP